MSQSTEMTDGDDGGVDNGLGKVALERLHLRVKPPRDSKLIFQMSMMLTGSE